MTDINVDLCQCGEVVIIVGGERYHFDPIEAISFAHSMTDAALDALEEAAARANGIQPMPEAVQ